MSVNANTQIYDKVIDRAAMIRLYERRVNGKVELVLDGHAVKIDKLIREAELSQKGFERLRETVDQQLSSTYKETFSLTKRSLFDLVSDQVSYAYQNLETAVGKIWKTERPPKRVAEEIVLETPLYGDTRLEAGWAGIATGERKRLEAVIRKGIAEGKTVDQIALEVRRGNVHNISRNQAKGLVVTAITATATQADHAVYKANEKALQGWQYVAVLDARTTPICAHRDGEIYLIGDKTHLPPAHFHCRSTTVPVFKSWQQMAELEGVAQVRKENIANLSKKQIAFYDGQTPLRETYADWLTRQPKDVQFRHLGDYKKVEMFNNGQLELSQFTNPEGNSIGIKELRRMTDSGYTLSGDTYKFAAAKHKLDAMQLWARTPEDFYGDGNLQKTLRDYYILQTRDLEGTLSLTNYRGSLIHNKKATKQRVLTSPPKEEQLKFNPITGRYEDTRLYQPNPAVLANNLRLLDESDKLLDRDKQFIRKFVEDLEDTMSVNERAVVADNLRIVFTRFRDNGEQWGNFKAVVQSQIKFDVMNVSDAIETQLRRDVDVLKKLNQSNYIDSVLGPTQLQDLHDNFLDNIEKKNTWEDRTAPKIARELREVFDIHIPPHLRYTPSGGVRLSERDLHQFYLRFAHRLSLADSPDRDQFAVALGRDLYNLANMNGDRRKWYDTGMKLLEAKNVKKFFEVETFGVQKRRMKSRLSDSYFGPYYDTLAYNIRVVDPRIQEYAKLSRKVELGLRVAVTSDKNRLLFREGFKTYFIDKGPLGLVDTRIPITSTSSFSDFPEEFVDKDMVNALNWAAKTEYRIDEDYYDFVRKLLYFEDDKGKAKFYNELNEYRKYITSRGDAYERFKAMEWLRNSGKSFSNHPFIDHRARIYDRGLISPQSGETFRPFLNTKEARYFSRDDYLNLQDQIGAFVGGLSDKLEGNFNSLTITGRQKIADRWRPEMVKIGNHMLRGKPGDIRAILESDLVAQIDGEEVGKFYRFALESAKIDNFLRTSVLRTGVSDALLREGEKALAAAQRLTGRELFTIGDDVGFIGIERRGNSVKIASIYLKPEARGLGYAERAIAQVTGNSESFAFVEPSNKSSLALFERLGYFVESSRKIDGVTYNVVARNAGDNFLKTPLKGKYSEGLSFYQTGNKKYELDTIFALTEDTPVTAYPVAKLDWVLKYAKGDPTRIAKADLNTPVLVAMENGRPVVIDGLHRLSKAAAEGRKDILIKFVDQEIMESALLRDNIYHPSRLRLLSRYKTALVLEQDASSSGAQIIALTTRNKQLAELSNVVPTTQKRRLYDEIAAATYNDPRFRKINEKLGLTEKDLRKAAKA